MESEIYNLLQTQHHQQQQKLDQDYQLHVTMKMVAYVLVKQISHS